MASVVTQNLLLLAPIFVTLMIFTLVANAVSINANNQYNQIIDEEYENQLTSTMQQLYQMLSINNVQNCVVTMTNPLPAMIDSQPYKVTGAIDAQSGVLTLSFHFPGTNTQNDVSVTLGPGAHWTSSELDSTSSNSIIIVRKIGSALYFSFG